MTYPPNPHDRQPGDDDPWSTPPSQPKSSDQPPSQPFGQQPYGQSGYGQPPYGQPGYGQPPYNPAQQNTGTAIASMVCSIIGLVACGIFLAIPGVILGHSAMGKINRGEAGGRGMAMAGLIIGYIVIALTVIGVAVVLIAGFATDWTFE